MMTACHLALAGTRELIEVVCVELHSSMRCEEGEQYKGTVPAGARTVLTTALASTLGKYFLVGSCCKSVTMGTQYTQSGLDSPSDCITPTLPPTLSETNK